MVGIGDLLGAQFLAAIGGDMAASPPQITSPATPDSHPPHATPVAAPATCTDPAATAAGYSASST